MRPRTLRRRGRFYRRKRSGWKLNSALILLGAVLVGLVVVDMNAGAPAPTPAEDMAKRIAASATSMHGPAPTAPAELGSTPLDATESTPVSAPAALPVRAGSLLAGTAPDRRVHEMRANRRDFDDAGAPWGASTVRDVNMMEPAPATGTPQPLVMHTPARPEGCKTCGDEVPF